MSGAPDRSVVHVIEDGSVEEAIFALLRERCGVTIDGVRGINASEALRHVLVVAGHFLAGMPPNPRAEVINEFRRAVNQKGDAMAKEYRERQRN